jgi:hypothetical protein
LIRKLRADAVVGKLRSVGFSDNDISVLVPDKGSTRDFAHKKETKMPEGATVGVSTGGVVGGTVGLLSGIGALAIPGLGPFIAAGSIMAALGGGAIGAGVGGLTGALVGLGIPEYEAKRYEGKVKEGGILISVHSESNDESSRAKNIFKDVGAHEISSIGEAHSDRKAEDGMTETRIPVVTPRSGRLESFVPQPAYKALYLSKVWMTNEPHRRFYINDPNVDYPYLVSWIVFRGSSWVLGFT